jgi:hypothetical protein
MANMRLAKMAWAVLGIIVLAGIGLTGCASMQGSQSTGSTTDTTGAAAPTLYRDFPDILLPSELKMDPKRTYIVQGAGTTTGVLTLKGWVDRDSIIAFFKSSMRRDNWRELASFKSPLATSSSFMVYYKENRTAIISIHEELIYTYVDIAVAPSATDAAGEGIKATPLQ